MSPTYEEAAREWAAQHPGAFHGSTLPYPPPEFIQAFEAAELAKRVDELEERVARLESNG